MTENSYKKSITLFQYCKSALIIQIMCVWFLSFQGAKLFYLSGMVNEEYQKTEVHNLCRFISVMKFRPLQWRLTHPYIVVDR